MGPAEVGRALRLRREERELTQQQVANLAGLSVSFVCQIERRSPDRPLPPGAAKIARVLGYDMVEHYILRPRRRRRASR
jgi:transcriptional regulator with XRE-family HTH domain